MSSGIVIGSDYGYTLAGIALSAVTLQGLHMAVGATRKEAGVEYPALYADDADAKKDKLKYKFNCAQRGVQNINETYTGTVFALAVAGTMYPREAGIAGVLYTVGMIAFARGYATGDPDSRYKGFGRLGVVMRLSSFAATAASAYVI